jgi:tetratricopeptide (TPR) repeat protein
MNRKQRRMVAKQGTPIGAALRPSFGPSVRIAELLALALGYHRAGQLMQAESHYRKILAIDPNHIDSLHLLGVLAHQNGHNETAVDLLRKAISLNDRTPTFHSDLALALRALGRMQEAVVHYTRALALQPDSAEAHNNLGSSLRNLARLDDAIVEYRRALALKPDYADARNNLGNALRDQGKLEEAIAEYRRALALNPGVAEAHNNLGSVLRNLGKSDEAVAEYRRALALKPGAAETHYNLGNALTNLGRIDEAVAEYRRALALKPDYAEAHNNLGNALSHQGRFDEAVAEYRQALELKSDYAEAHYNLGNALSDQGKLDEAVAEYRQALALKPDSPETYNNLGNALRDQGRLEEARHAYEKAVKLEAGNPAFYFGLASVKRFAPDDAELAALEKLEADPAFLSAEERMYLHFALGKACADLGDPERSFRHFMEGNALKRQQTDYDEAAIHEQFGRIRSAFTAELMRDKRILGNPSPVPVFIIGMPRSGTTLIEQILASHPKVFGGGELMNMPNGVARLHRPAVGAAQFPEAVSSMDAEELRRFGASYVAAVRDLAPDAERITDKMPTNFRFVGLIHLVLPNARIVCARRDPLDTCLSCFSNLFSSNKQPYAYDLAELGRFYRAYEALMEHWRSILPPGVMLEVQYEEVVADLDGQAHRIVAHCGLEWDDACLAFYKAKRPVRTASAAQVRQPIYRTSIGRWHAYKHLLGPLIEALGV